MKVLIILFALSSFLSGCSSYVSQYHKEFDRADGKRRPQKRYGDKFDFYRQNQKRSKNGMIGSNQKKVMLPTVKRSYQQPKRIKADDLTDQGSSGSLWVGKGDDNFLFTNNDKKSNGDIVLINVESKLKNLITAELKRAFPEKKRKKKKDDEKKATTDTAQAGADGGAATGTSPDAGEAKGDQVFDRISSIVIEEINKDHLLLRGRKFLLYKNHKRLIEVQALVPRRTVKNTDEVDSSEIIESNVSVVR